MQRVVGLTRRSGAVIKKAAVEHRLSLLVQTHAQTSIRRLLGRAQWDENLKKSRSSSPNLAP